VQENARRAADIHASNCSVLGQRLRPYRQISAPPPAHGAQCGCAEPARGGGAGLVARGQAGSRGHDCTNCAGLMLPPLHTIATFRLRTPRVCPALAAMGRGSATRCERVAGGPAPAGAHSTDYGREADSLDCHWGERVRSGLTFVRPGVVRQPPCREWLPGHPKLAGRPDCVTQARCGCQTA
jgi:hypothetical protein